MKDIAAAIHRGLYGKSDKANSSENQGEEFQTGFAIGKENEPDCITSEYFRRGEPLPDTDEYHRFEEWKRGFWAGRMQETVVKFYERHS